jgi:hypothetical protein
MSLIEIDRAPSDMSTNSSVDNSLVIEEIITVDSVEYTKNKIYEFLSNVRNKDIISSVNDRYFIANQTLSTIKTISLENQNSVLIAVLLSIFNEYGAHGSKYSGDSIWNEYGSYGGKYSSSSPFNDYTSSAPMLIKNNQVIARLTTNQFLQNAVNPYALKNCTFY